jgi:uncharacterized protein
MVRRLEIILKITERCNIACSYCYYFENETKSALSRPSRLTDNAFSALVGRVKEALHDKMCDSIRIIFHGGEPLLIGKIKFREICRTLVNSVPPEAIEFCIQTNAMLIDDEWVAIFQEFNVSVGVSIDGPAAIHDYNRRDKNGNPTHAKVVKGIQKLVTASRDGQLSYPGALIVIQPYVSPSEIYWFIVNELGIKTMDFLLPDSTWDTPNNNEKEIGSYLCELFDCWVNHDDPNVEIRFLKSAISLFLGGSSYLGGFGPVDSSALTILSNGEINGDDFLRVCGDDVIDLKMNLDKFSLNKAFEANRILLDEYGARILPSACVNCTFENVCCGGQLTHRFSKKDRFNNPSIYCSGLKLFYEHILSFLLKTGNSPDRLAKVLMSPR